MARRIKAAPSSSPAPPNTPRGQGRRRQPVVISRPAPSRRARCAEVAGGTAAECAAVCCCCPCGLVALLVLAVVRVPAGLCRRAFLRRKKTPGRATHVGLLRPRVGAAGDDGEVGGEDAVLGVAWSPADKSPAIEASEMEEEMWAQFYGGGFWRSLSQREM